MRKGFTIIELLVVITIISLLVTVVIVSFRDVRAKARDARRIGDMNAYIRTLAIYEVSNNVFPTGTATSTDSDFNTPGGNNLYDRLVVEKKVFYELPVDPVNSNNYYYKYDSGGTSYTLNFCPETKILEGYKSCTCPPGCEIKSP